MSAHPAGRIPLQRVREANKRRRNSLPRPGTDDELDREPLAVLYDYPTWDGGLSLEGAAQEGDRLGRFAGEILG